MTISDQLRFSILSAPVAAADRRVLSQAWYSALYPAATKQSCPPISAKSGAGGSYAAPRICARRVSAVAPRCAAPRCLKHEPAFPRAIAERRSPQLEVARKIGELAARRACKRIAATFVIDGSRSRVRVLVTADGAKVRIIAICAKRLAATVAAALAQARYTAASGGVQVYAQTLEGEEC